MPEFDGDIQLLNLGWVRNAHTDEYAQNADGPWISRADARLQVFGDETPPAAPKVERTQMIDVLIEIRDSLARIERALTRGGGIAT